MQTVANHVEAVFCFRLDVLPVSFGDTLQGEIMER
jgi:hypothetical protein